jgi:hypothetical protein
VGRLDGFIGSAAQGRVERPAFAGADGGPNQETWTMEASHLSALEQKHLGLERRIQEELNRPAPDDTLLQDLKRRKLRLKDELTRN